MLSTNNPFISFHCCGEGLPVYVVIVASVSHDEREEMRMNTFLHFTMYGTSNKTMLKP